MKRTVAITTLLVASVGCVVGPNYTRPTTPTQEHWKEAQPTTNVVTLPPRWWEIFADDELDKLESQALDANQDLKRAVARVDEARALAHLSKADLFPQISANRSHSYDRASRNIDNAPPKLETRTYSRSIDISYEVDAWGRVRRAVEAAEADAAAVQSDMQVVLLTLTSDLARNYYTLRSLDTEKAVVEATLALRQDTVRLQNTRFQAGLINEMDATRARTELANVEADLHAITRTRAQVEHALAVLCGQPVAEFAITALSSATIPPAIPAGLPSELLQRRPDLAEAEEALRAASARIGVAKAAYYPTIRLTGAAGLATADLETFVDAPSRFWSLGPSIHIPIFEGGQNRANLKAAEARYEQSLAAYRGAVLNAFREVEDALSDVGGIASQNEAINRALESSRQTVALADERYQKGLSSYLEVVDAQRAALQAEREGAQLRGQRMVSTILLAKALGGGWQSNYGFFER